MTSPLLAFLEGADLIIVAVVIMVLFGGSQLPKFARNLGQAKKELEAGLHEDEEHESPKAVTEVESPKPDQSAGSGTTGTS